MAASSSLSPTSITRGSTDTSIRPVAFRCDAIAGTGRPYITNREGLPHPRRRQSYAPPARNRIAGRALSRAAVLTLITVIRTESAGRLCSALPVMLQWARVGRGREQKNAARARPVQRQSATVVTDGGLGALFLSLKSWSRSRSRAESPSRFCPRAEAESESESAMTRSADHTQVALSFKFLPSRCCGPLAQPEATMYTPIGLPASLSLTPSQCRTRRRRCPAGDSKCPASLTGVAPGRASHPSPTVVSGPGFTSESLAAVQARSSQ